MSLAADLHVFALSDIITEGNPLRLTKRRNACRNDSAERASVSSKCTALVAAHVNKHMYVLAFSFYSIRDLT